MDSNDTDRIGAARALIGSLLPAADATRRFLSAAVADSGLTFQQYNVLRIVRGAAPDPLATMEVAERMLEKTPGVTRLMDSLESRGLIRRERCDDDRRRVLARITESGQALLASIDAEVDRADLALVEGLSEDAVRRLVRTLRTVEANAR